MASEKLEDIEKKGTFTKIATFTFKIAEKQITIDRNSVVIDPDPGRTECDVAIFSKDEWYAVVEGVEKCWKLLKTE